MGKSLLPLAVLAALSLACAPAAKTVKKDLKAPTLEPELHQAAMQGQASRVRALLAHGASVDEPGNWAGGCTALVHAASAGSLETVKVLVEAGAKAAPVSGQVLGGAIQRLNVDMVDYLLAHGADPNQRGFNALETLGYAMRNPLGDEPLKMREMQLRIARSLIKAKADTSRRAAGQYTPLMTAVAANSREIVGLLLDAGADPNLGTPNRYWALDVAGSPFIREMLVKAGARPGPKSSPTGSKPKPAPPEPELHAALLAGDAAKVRRLMASGADPNAKCAAGAAAYGHVDWGHPDLLDALLESGRVDMSSMAAGGQIFNAALHGEAEWVERLLKAGADPNMRIVGQWRAGTLLEYASQSDYGGATMTERLRTVKAVLDAKADAKQGAPLAWAVAAHLDKRIIALLIAAGADVNAKGGPWRMSPLALARQFGDDGAVALLKKAGAKEDFPVMMPRRAEPESPLCEAAGHGDAVAVKRLLAQGASPKQDCRGSTPLMLSVFSHRAAEAAILERAPQMVETARLLVEAGADLAFKDSVGHNALIYASMGVEPELVRVLLEAGSDPDYRDNDGMTAMMHVDVTEAGCGPGRSVRDSEWESKYAILSELLKAGADPDVADNWGGTQLMMSVLDGQERLAGMLLDAGADPFLATKGGMTALDFAAHHPALAARLKAASPEAGRIGRLAEWETAALATLSPEDRKTFERVVRLFRGGKSAEGEELARRAARTRPAFAALKDELEFSRGDSISPFRTETRVSPHLSIGMAKVLLLIQARRGDADAQTILAFKDSPSDLSGSVARLTRAASSGQARAQCRLGAVLWQSVRGDGVEPYKWLVLCSQARPKDGAAKLIAEANTILTPDQISHARDLAAAFKAAGH